LHQILQWEQTVVRIEMKGSSQAKRRDNQLASYLHFAPTTAHSEHLILSKIKNACSQMNTSTTDLAIAASLIAPLSQTDSS